VSLTARTVTGVSWMAGARLVQLVLQFGLSVVLMRLLGPEAFGLVAMVLVFSAFLSVFTDMGFSSALVQRLELTEEHRSTVFWMAIGLGGLLCLSLVLASPFVAAFYHEPLLGPLTAWIALGFVLDTPGMVPRALLQRSMQFDRIAKIEVLSLVISGIVGAGSAWRGAGVWSLVAQSLTYSLVASALMLWQVDWRPRPIFSLRAVRDLAAYGAGLSGFSVVNYWARSADNLLIGRFIGTAALGFYSRAYFLMLMPLKSITGVLGPVMFPALASIQHDRERVRGAYLRAMRLMTFWAFPLMMGMATVAEPFVLGLFGPEWREVIPLIQILAFVGMIQTLCNPVGWIYTSQGRTDLMFWWGVGGGGTLIAFIAVGIVLGGVETVAWAYLAGNILITIPCLAIPGRLIGMRVRDVFRVSAGNFASALGMAAFVWAVKQFLPPNLPALLSLALLVSAGVVCYIGIAQAARQSALSDSYGLLRQAVAPLLLRRRVARGSGRL
jgi:O-antigen/teichoic acid export membrane protein